MKRYLLPVLLIVGALLPSAGAFGQSRQVGPNTPMPMKNRFTLPADAAGNRGGKIDAYHGLTSRSLPASITVPGLDMIPVTSNSASAAYQQSNGRSMHNIQVDPTNPNHIHALIQGMQNTSADDTVGLFSRRLYYTYSTDAGVTWKAPVELGDKRTGYGDLLLYNRDGQYVALVVGHTVTNAAASNAMVSVWLEKGAPGDGNFSQTVTGEPDIIWANGAISKDGKTLYVIASRQATTTASLDQLHFGTFTINADGTTTWNGFTGYPGDNEDFPDRGKTTGGEYRIRVAADGRIGVAWRNSVNTPEDQRDLGIYYSESTDGGDTWSGTNTTTVAAIGEDDGTGYQWYPTGSFDFWYEGNSPRFVWVQYPSDFANNFFQPYNTTLMYWEPQSGLEPDTVASADATGNRINPIPNSLAVITEPGNTQVDNLIGYPAVARFDANQFAVFYTGFQNGFWQAVDTGFTVVGPDTLLYSSIFYSLTRDGGRTWEEPKEFLTNSGTGPYFDYRFPSTSDYNPKTGGTGSAHVLVEVDTAAGVLVTNGTPGFDLVGFGHKAQSFPNMGVADNGVRASFQVQQNYPNPFNSTSTIRFTLAEPASVSLTVEDMMGREVAPPMSARFVAGDHTMKFNGASLPAGVYRYALHVNGEVVSKTMTLLK